MKFKNPMDEKFDSFLVIKNGQMMTSSKYSSSKIENPFEDLKNFYQFIYKPFKRMNKILITTILNLFLSCTILLSQEDTIRLMNDVLYNYYLELSNKNSFCKSQISEYQDYILKQPNISQKKGQLLKKLHEIEIGVWKSFSKDKISKEEIGLLKGKVSIDEFYNFCEDCYYSMIQFKSMIAEKIIDSEDFEFIVDNEKLREIIFYKIKENEVIAEIGVGSGYNMEILNLLYPKNRCYVNEVEKGKLNYLRTQFVGKPNIEIIKGETESCGLEDKEIDVIIARNVVHHFEQKTQMIDSIIDSMKSEGRLIVLEQFIDNELNETACSHLMEREEFEDLMRQRGLKLINHHMIYETREIFEYRME